MGTEVGRAGEAGTDSERRGEKFRFYFQGDEGLREAVTWVGVSFSLPGFCRRKGLGHRVG